MQEEWNKNGGYDVLIEHNPYTVSTVIKVNNEIPAEDSQLNQFMGNIRFQMWVDKIPFALRDEYNEDEFWIIFHGTDLDYQDLCASAQLANTEGMDIHTKLMPSKPFGEKEDAINKLFNQARQLPFEQLNSASVQDAVKKAFTDDFEVNVVATMSAGKSTLINSLLRRKLMPSKQGACTAIITRIKDNDNPAFKAEAFDTDGNQIEQYPELDYKTMKALNGNKSVGKIIATGDIPFVTTKEASLVLIDTPGPNNARDKNHGKITDKALDESSKMLVLFVMNGGTLHDDAQDSFLRKIAKSMSVGGKQSRERFMFVINKMDAYDDDDDDIAGETIPDTIRYLEDLGIKNPNIFPVAALPALQIREYLNAVDESKKEKLLQKVEPVAEKLNVDKQLHLETYASLPHSCQVIIDAELKEAIDNNDVLGQALIHSGIRGIEETIRMYVTKYCRPAKITNVVNVIRHALESADAFASTQKDIASQKETLEKVGREIEDLQRKLTSKADNNAFKERIKELKIDTDLDKEINAEVDNVLKELKGFLSSCPAEMSEDDAMDFIHRFIKLSNEKQDSFQAAMEKLLERDIKQKGKQLLEEYIRRLKKISSEFNVGPLTIDLSSFVMSELKQFDTDDVIDNSLASRIETHKETRSRTVTRRAKGLKRLFNPLRWFNPEYEETEYYDVEVKNEITFVSRDKLNNQLISPVTKGLRKSHDDTLEFAKEKTDELKDFFFGEFDKVDAILIKLTNELAESTRSKEAAAIALNRANNLLAQLGEVNRQLDAILEI